MAEVFNEDSLRAAVVGVWGAYGAHVDVLDHLIKEAKKASNYREALMTVNRYGDGLRASNWSGLADAVTEALNG